MPTRVPLTLPEGHDATLLLTISPEIAGDSLAAVDSLALILHPAGCGSEDETVTLTTADPTQITIDARTDTLITAHAYIPASALQGGYPRAWHVDARPPTGTGRPAMYGPITVLPL